MKLYLRKEVREIIKGKGLKQSYIATELGISTSLLGSKLDETTSITIKELNKICSILLVPVEKLLTEEGLEAYEDLKKELEYMDTLNTNY